jgi:transposase-like protein
VRTWAIESPGVTKKSRSHSIEIYFSHHLNSLEIRNGKCSLTAPYPEAGMSTSTQLTPAQAGVAIALGFGLNFSAVAAEFDIHRSTLHNWMKIPEFATAVQTAQAEFEPDGPEGPFDTFRHPDSNEINNVRNEMAAAPFAGDGLRHLPIYLRVADPRR